MAGGISTPALIAAAAAVGAFGFFTAGYQRVDLLNADMAEARGSTDQFGVNIFVPGPVQENPRAVLAYRELLLPLADSMGVDLPLPGGVDDDDWDAKVDLLISRSTSWVSFTFGVPPADVLNACSPMRRADIAGTFDGTLPGDGRSLTAYTRYVASLRSAHRGRGAGDSSRHSSPRV